MKEIELAEILRFLVKRNYAALKLVNETKHKLNFYFSIEISEEKDLVIVTIK